MSSKRRLRRRSCESKKRYADAGIADREAQFMSSKFGASWRAYKCQFCNGYHVGRPNHNQKQSMRARHTAK